MFSFTRDARLSLHSLETIVVALITVLVASVLLAITVILTRVLTPLLLGLRLIITNTETSLWVANLLMQLEIYRAVSLDLLLLIETMVL